jgi:hypothetical protein
VTGVIFFAENFDTLATLVFGFISFGMISRDVRKYLLGVSSFRTLVRSLWTASK